MGARTFNGTSDQITTSLGSLGFQFGPGTIAALLLMPAANSAVRWAVFAGADSGTPRYGLGLSAANAPAFRCRGNQINAPSTVTLGEWYLLAATKATGTVAPRFHTYRYSNNTFNHENAVATSADSTAPTTNGFLGGENSAVFWNSDLAVAAVWDIVLTDSQCESLPFNLSAWYAPKNPVAMWLLDQAAVGMKVLDITGNHADESAISGTSVSANSVPIWSPGDQAWAYT